MDFMETIRKRYSCRAFNNEPVKDDLIETILQVGGNAPVGRGAYDTLHFTVVKDAELLDKLRHDPGKPDSKIDPMFNAQALILASANEESFALANQNVGCALSYMSLAATTLGVESLYVYGFLNRMNEQKTEAISEVVVPEGYTILGGLALGYTDKDHASKEELVNLVSTDYQK
ncbi:MAG: nitroreductase family protein [Fastidiosipilaceae bacterium]|jgi:nitroreductase